MELVPVSQELENLEKVIEDGLQSFVAVGNALMEIKNGKHYKERGFKTFEAYCKERFGFTGNYGNRQIQATKVVEILVPIGTEIREAQARELAPLLSDPEQLRSAWGMAQEKYGQTVTAAEIKSVVKSIKNDQTTIEPDDDDTFEEITPESKPSGGRQTYREIFQIEVESLPSKLKNIDKEFPAELVARIAEDPEEYRIWIGELKAAKSRLSKIIANLEFNVKVK